MCNSLHSDSVPIRKKGKGWKIFRETQRGIVPMFWGSYPYPVNKKIIWDSSFNKDDDGFCFFLNKKDAIRYKNWCNSINHKEVILPILYERGLGKHLEQPIMSNKAFMISLCKEFTIIGEEENVQQTT